MNKDKLDPGQTYVLEETVITRTSSIEELAEYALREFPGTGEEASSEDSQNDK